MKKVKFPTTGRVIIRFCISLMMIVPFSCSSFLDIIPDDIATVDHAFTNAREAEKFLFTCYSFLPQSGVPASNVGLTAGDEIWFPEGYKRFDAPAWDYIARSETTPEVVRPNFWSGSDWALNLFSGIRDCNTFIEKMGDLSLVQDISTDERARWIAEAKFLKAYYHFCLLRLYGPIPIIDKAIPISADPSTVQVKRESMDDCVNYIKDLLDEGYYDLPLVINNTYSELGRITKPINRALKAKLLLMAASPLFNGNSAYERFENIDKTLFFSNTDAEDPQKWVDAAEAAHEALTVAHMAGHKLYEFTLTETGFSMTPKSMIQMSIRNAVCEKWNSEIIWGLSSNAARADPRMQNVCMPKLDAGMDDSKVRGSMAPTFQVVKQFYTKNGVPINEDKTLDFSNPESLRVVQASEAVDMETGHTTARINFDREDRFYATMGFDGGKWLMSYHINRSDIGNYVVHAKLGELSYGVIEASYSVTGYYTKKLVHWSSGFTASTTSVAYPWPEIRLADVYLMYAEALNEAQGPVDDVHRYLNMIRERAGLKGVEESWTKYSTNPTKPTTKEGMREIIRNERLIELAFEGSRYWDLLRWKLAEEYLNAPIVGWDISQSDASSYYRTRTVAQRRFVAPRDYFLPIQNSELMVNNKLVQNPGW